MTYWREQAEKIVNEGLFDAAVELMDDELREQIHAAMAPCDEISFLAAYLEIHFDIYGEVFIIN